MKIDLRIQDNIESFLKEAIIMQKVRHENVLKLEGILIIEDNIPLIILPFITNGDLKRYIERNYSVSTIIPVTIYLFTWCLYVDTSMWQK